MKIKEIGGVMSEDFTLYLHPPENQDSRQNKMPVVNVY
jgi:hypothetical protein